MIVWKWIEKAKISVYYCRLFLDSILFKSAGISICYTECSQGQYSNIILTLESFSPFHEWVYILLANESNFSKKKTRLRENVYLNH